MFTVMRDPVILPTSRTIIDRSTIKSHLLSDSKDPFNRVPLTIEDVIPGECSHKSCNTVNFYPTTDPELKERIEAFLTERRSRKAAPSGEAPKMDVD
jgi:ubiquitin conjugation factor E4 B